MNKGKVLFIAHRIPYPPNKGDKIRTYHMLRYLTERYQVAVACMIDDPVDLEYLEPVRRMADQVFYALRRPLAMKFKVLEAVLSGEPFTKLCFYSSTLQKDIDDFLEGNDVKAVICFCSSSAEYVFRSRHFASLQKKVLLADLIDVDSEKWQQYAEKKTGVMRWLYRREAEHLRPYEQQIINAFDQTFLVSEEERNVMDKFANVTKVEALSNGVDLDYFSPETHRGGEVNQKACKLVFSGAMDYWPNIEGAAWFAEKIFPLVKESFPQATFCIAGRNPTESVLALKKINGVVVTGTVPDMRNYLATATICVVPLKIARGIQNKVLEAMAMGKPVIATSGAATGTKTVTGKELVIADEEQQMADEIIALLADPVRQSDMGRKARDYVEREHSWGAHLARLDEIIEGKS